MKLNKMDILYILAIVFILSVSIYMKDSVYAIISALFGISYTILLGKGRPEGYLFGIIGTISGTILLYSQSLWGSFLLHGLYFLPMEIIGLVCWNKNMNKENKTVIKTKLSKKENVALLCLCLLSFIVLSFIFIKTNDKLPYVDSFITTVSLAGMYLTVKRCYEQWVLWTLVNIFSIVMWFEVHMQGTRVLSILGVRVIYLMLGIYFFIKWKKEVSNNFAK